MKIEWRDPEVKGPGIWMDRLEPVKNRPGTWAMVYVTGTARTAYGIRHGLATSRYRIPEGVWEFKARKTDEGGEIYARFLGKEKTGGSTPVNHV